MLVDYANTFAPVALLLWVPVSLALFAWLRPPVALALVLVGGALLLPERVQFAFQGFPELGKPQIPVLSALLSSLIWCPRRLARARPGRGLEGLVIAMMLAGVMTARTNTDPLAFGSKHLSGLTLYDALSMAWIDLTLFGLPFFLGRAIYRSRRDANDLLLVLAVAGALYSPLVLFEARMSPRLHIFVYGFHQHDWLQTQRLGGWRPVVFMSHGLALSLFMVICAEASTIVSRVRQGPVAFYARILALWLVLAVLACRSLGAIVFAILFVPLVAFVRARIQIAVAVCLAGLILIYPGLRMGGSFPTQAVVDAAGRVSSERAASLQTRFDHEEMLLHRAQERILFGWGGWGRGLVWDERGGKQSITDGFWIIEFGQRGVVGFATAFLLLLLPVGLALRCLRRTRDRVERLQLGGLSVIVVICALDLLPNGLFNSMSFFLSGALCGLSSLKQEVSRGARPRRDVGARRAAEVDRGRSATAAS